MKLMLFLHHIASYVFGRKYIVDIWSGSEKHQEIYKTKGIVADWTALRIARKHANYNSHSVYIWHKKSGWQRPYILRRTPNITLEAV